MAQYPIETWAGVLEHPLLLIKLSILITTASPPLTVDALLLLDRLEAYIVYVVALQNELPWAYQAQA